MDAKPQRLRAASRRDENMPPSNMASQMKTLHSRNKSTPALSSLAKGPVKTSTILNGLNGQLSRQRTAFADVSNTNRFAASNAKDDLAILKETSHAPLKVVSTLQPLREVLDTNVQQANKQQPALLRPAQRPLSAAIPRPALSSIPHANLATIESNQSTSVADPVNRNLNRKRTTVFRETSSTSENEVAALVQESAKLVTTAIAPVHQVLEVSKDKRLPPAPLPVQEPVLPIPETEDERRHTVQQELQDFSRDLIAQIEQTFAKADDAMLPIEDEQLSCAVEPSSQPLPHGPADQIQEKHVVVNEQDLYLPALETQLPALEPAVVGAKVPLSAHSDIPEYFEEDDEEEYYDAEGYTTARSIRSRGDNTTGGLTTFVEPRVTARVVKELEAAREYVLATRTEDDIEDEAWDTSMVAEYGDDIFEYMRVLENKMRPNEHYMDNQNEIQWSMRAVLMDWMIQVHTRFSLLPETLFLAVNYIDRFLSCKVVSLGKLQLVGATALFVAAKYEEINCPSVQEIVYMVDNAYNVDEILKAERFMLSMLNFELGWPGPMSFLRKISKADEYDLDTRTMAKYFLEVMIMDERFVACPPSFASAGAHCLSRLILDKGDWTLAHTHYSQYTWWQLYDLVAKIVECCQQPRKHHAAVFEKYQEKKYKRCALTAEARLTSGAFKLPSRSTGRDSSSYGWQSTLWRRF